MILLIMMIIILTIVIIRIIRDNDLKDCLFFNNITFVISDALLIIEVVQRGA